MSQPNANTGTMKKGQRGHSTRRRFTFSEPSAPAELAVIKETYTNTRQQTNIPNQANSTTSSTPVQHERKLVAKVQEERERAALRKGRSLPTMGRAKRERRMADLFGHDSPSQQDSGSASSIPKSRSPAKKTTSTPVIKIAAPRPCLTDPTTPVRWAGGAFENSPPPSSLPIPVFDDEDLSCGSTSDGEQPQPVDSTLIPFISSSPARRGAANPNQSSPLPAENQPLSPQATMRPHKEFIHQPQPPLNLSTSPLAGLHHPHQQPVFLFPSPHYVGPLNHSPEPSAFYQPLSPQPVAYGAPIAVPAHPQPSRDLDQISSDLRRMLGISVST